MQDIVPARFSQTIFTQILYKIQYVFLMFFITRSTDNEYFILLCVVRWRSWWSPKNLTFSIFWFWSTIWTSSNVFSISFMNSLYIISDIFLESLLIECSTSVRHSVYSGFDQIFGSSNVFWISFRNSSYTFSDIFLGIKSFDRVLPLSISLEHIYLSKASSNTQQV